MYKLFISSQLSLNVKKNEYLYFRKLRTSEKISFLLPKLKIDDDCVTISLADALYAATNTQYYFQQFFPIICPILSKLATCICIRMTISNLSYCKWRHFLNEFLFQFFFYWPLLFYFNFGKIGVSARNRVRESFAAHELLRFFERVI